MWKNPKSKFTFTLSFFHSPSLHHSISDDEIGCDYRILASSAALQNDTYPTNGIHRSHRNQQMPQHLRHSSAGSHSDTMLLLNTTQLRRVQTSLKRLEKQQDEFFEL